MKPRLILASLGLFALAILSLGLQVQGQPKVADPDKDEIITSEQVLKHQFAKFQEALLKLKQRMALGTPDERKRAEVLGKILDECDKLAINQEFTKMIELMRGAKLSSTSGTGPLKDQSDIIAQRLTRILDMLRDSNSNRLSEDVANLKKIIADLDAVINKEKIAEAITGLGKTDPKELLDIQKKVTKETDDVRKKIDDFLKGKDNKGGETAPVKGENKGAGKEDGAKGEAKNDGKKNESAKGEPKDAGKESKDPKGETKPGQDKAGQAGKSPDSEPKAGAKAGDKGKEGSPPAGAKENKGDMADKGKEGSAKETKGDKKEGSAKDDGKKAGDPMKDGPQGSAKGDDKKAGDPKSGDAPDSKAKPGGGEPMAGGAKQEPATASKVSKGGDKGGEGKSGGEAKGGDGKQGEAKSGDSKSGQGQAKDGGASPSGSDAAKQTPPASEKGDGPPPPPSSGDKKSKENDEIANSAKKLKEAGYDQQSAEDKIAKAKTPDALKKQADAIAKMEEAKKKLENLLRQMREEEIERVLAALQARCEKMLMMQQAVLIGTVDTEASVFKSADRKPTRENKIAAQQLSDKEKEIVQEANKCIDILQAEGSAVAFPEVFQQLRTDMMHVQKRLDLGDVHDVTQGIERDIIDSLKEMIDALKKARDDNQADPGKPGPPGSGKPPDPKLLELVQELKMVRALQKRVNDRTEFYAKRFPGQEQAADPQVVRDLRALADRQQRIQDIVSRIAKGDNK